jgi:hypothetical protein
VITRSEHLTADNGARVEVGTIVAPNGREHSAQGSIVDHDHGIVCGYVNARGVVPLGRSTVGRTWDLTTWDGATIGTVEVVSVWSNPRGIFSAHVYAFRATIDGKRYHGRGGGPGLFVRLRLSASK